MKRASIAATVLAALLLTGCSGSADETPSEPVVSGESATEDAVEETPEPLVAETPESAEGDDTDAQFLAYVRDNLLPETQIPKATDEQLIAAGHDACDQLGSGIALEDVRAVEGETPHPSTGAYYDTSAIMSGAILSYCPEFS